MHEPMTLLQQVNTFKKSNPQYLIIDRTVRQRRRVDSSFNNTVDDNIELKTRSINVYASNHLVTNGKLILPGSERNRLGQLLLPSIYKDTNDNENYQPRKRKSPLYRKSLFHFYSPKSTPIDLSQLTARGIKRETHTTTPIIKDNDSEVNVQRHHVPPPTPSDTDLERSSYELLDVNQSRLSMRQSPIENEGYIPFRLPVLQRTSQFSRISTNSSSKDIRSTLSNYLQRFYC